MITRLLHFKIEPELKNEFVTIASSIIENFRQMKGHSETHLFFKYQEDDSVVISSSWDTLKDLEDFSRLELIDKLETNTRHMFISQPITQTMKKV